LVSDADFVAKANINVVPIKWYFEQRNYDCDIVVLCNASLKFIDTLSSNMRYKLSMYWFLSEAKLCSLLFPKEHFYSIDTFLFLSSNEQNTFIHTTGIHKEKTIHMDNFSNSYTQLCTQKLKACEELQLLKQEADSLEKLIKYQNIIPYFRTRLEAANYFLHQGNLYFNSPYLNIAESMFLKSWNTLASDSCANNIFLLYRKTKEYEKMYSWLNTNISKQFRHDFIQDIVEVLPNLSTMSRIGFLSYIKLMCNSSNDIHVSYRFAKSIGALSYHLRCMLQHSDATSLLRSLVTRLEQTQRNNTYLLESYTSAIMFASNYDYKDTQYIEDCRKYETFRKVDQIPQKFTPNSKVRIGFVSGDISNHPVTYVLNGFMEYMDKARFEIYLFDNSNPAVKQLQSIYLKQHVDHDITIYNKNVEESVTAIQECNLDILIEMTGHTSSSSQKIMDIVRKKPAKIICSYFGYPCTTGIQAVDFKLGDAITFPESSKHIFTEEFQMVKGGFHCFKPYDDTRITKTNATMVRFGIFNNPQKYTKQFIDTVSTILHKVPESQVYFCYNEFRDESMREFYKIELESRGVERSRVFFRSATTYKEYAEAFVDVDIALDTFPYNGGTVSMDCLNFSTPYITLLGNDYVSCVGASILTQVGHPELVANSIDEYVRNTVLLANNKPMLKQYHTNIRNDMYKSTLGDGKQFAKHFQEAMMEMLSKKEIKPQHIVSHQSKKKIGIFMRYQPDIYTNGAGMNCIFLRQSLEAIGYDVECLAYIDAGKSTLIYELLPYRYVDANTCDFKEYSVIIYGTGLPPASIYNTFKALGIQTFAFHPANSYDQFHNEAFIYPSKAISTPLIEQTYEHSANTSLVITSHVKTTSDYIHTLSRNNVPAKSIRHIWSPLFLHKNGALPKYKPKSPRSKVDLVIIEPNIGYCKSGWLPLVVCEAFYKANTDLVENVYSYNYPKDSTESTKMIRALKIWKDGKLKLMDRQHINDILFRFADSKNIPVFISHSINSELNYAYFDVLFSGFPFVHNSKSLQHENLGYYYDLVSEGTDAIQQALNHDPEKACAESSKFFETIHPLNASFLNELTTLMDPNVSPKIYCCPKQAVAPKEKKIGIFVRQQNFYSNGAGMNCIFLAQSLESLGYKVDLITNIDSAKPMTICDRLAYTYKDVKSCNYSDYQAILFGTQVAQETEYTKIRNLGIKILMFHPCNSYDAIHNEQFIHVSDHAELPLFEATFQKYADTVLVTDNHAATALTYVGTLNENKLDMQSLRLTWHPLFLYKDNVIPTYVSRNRESKIDIVILEANIGYCKCGWMPLVIAEFFNKTNPDRVGYVHYFTRPAENSEAMKMIQSLQIWKENKIVFYNRCPINDILSYFGNGKSNEYRNVAFLSHQINVEVNYAYFDILYSGFPFVHNSRYLKSKEQGYYYDTVEEGCNAISNTLHRDALQICERSKEFFDHVSPFNKSFLSELDSLVKRKQSLDRIQIIVVTASDDRKATMERQFAELDIPYPVHYLEAKILDKEAVGYVPETMSLIDKRTVLSTRSHIRAIELAGRDSSPEFSLIMEDDVAIHKTDFKRVLNEIMENHGKYVTGNSGIISLGWIPCVNYSEFMTRRFAAKIDERYRVFNHFFTPGTQAYLIQRDVAKKHTPMFCHNSYENLRKAVLDSDISAFNFNKDVIVFDDFGTKMLYQSILFPPVVIEQVNTSLIRGTVENPYWNQFFKGYENLKTQYWSFNNPTYPIQMVIISGNEMRKKRILKQFDELKIPFSYSFLEASTPDNSKSYLPESESDFIKRHICCARSHILAIEQAAQESAPEFTIIMEDDAALHKTMFVSTVIEIIQNWDKFLDSDSLMFSLGWIPMKNYSFYDSLKPSIENSIECYQGSKIFNWFAYGTQAYIIKKTAAIHATRILKQETWSDLKASVLGLNHLHIQKDNPILNVDNWLNRFLVQTILFPPLVIEQDLPSTIEDGGTRHYIKIWKPYFEGYESKLYDYWSFNGNAFTKIIPLGAHCNVSFLLQKLKIKKETSLFEWFQSESLDAISDAIEQIDWANIDPALIGGTDKDLYICNQRIFSYHYKLEDFKQIFIRRAKRFHETIMNNNNILFVRINMSEYNTSSNEVDRFMSHIKTINPNISNMKLLLISTINSPDTFNPIEHRHVVHKYILKSDLNDFTMKDDIKIHKIFKSYLDEIGYNTEDISNSTFDDHTV